VRDKLGYAGVSFFRQVKEVDVTIGFLLVERCLQVCEVPNARRVAADAVIHAGEKLLHLGAPCRAFVDKALLDDGAVALRKETQLPKK
jgi:hypothetical protein